ncbi:MAG: hypothetical protein AAGA97_01175 [Pseudomonadota bacterium]
MTNHWETHLYTYAVCLTQGAKIHPENLAGIRAKAIKHGHTEGECLIVEADPMQFVRDGFKSLSVLGKAVTMRRIMEAGEDPNIAHRIVANAVQPMDAERLKR